MCFAQDLKAVADAHDEAAVLGKLLYRLHDWSKTCYGASSQVVSVGEAAWDEDCVAALEVFRGVPEEGCGLVRDLFDDMVGVMVAVGPWEDEDAKFHRVKDS